MPHGREIAPLEPLPLADAVALVNRNSDRLQTTLRAKAGHARGQFTENDGSVRQYDVDAALLVRPPRCLRLDLSAFGDSQLIVGSNPTRYWIVQPGAETLVWGRHDEPRGWAPDDLPVRPDLIVEALGITPLPADTRGPHGPAQRITDEHQQILFLEYDDDMQGMVTKEYWLSRRPPRLVDRVVFRDAQGRAILDSQLTEYRPVTPDGPLAPHRVEARWPATGDHLVFSARGWAVLPQVTESHPGFAFPLDRGERFTRIIDWDAELASRAAPPPDAEPAAMPSCELDSAGEPATAALVGVLDFRVPPHLAPETGRQLADSCYGAIAETNRYPLLSRDSAMATVGADRWQAAAGQHDPLQAVAALAALPVQKLVQGEIEQHADNWSISLAWIDVATRSVETSVHVAVLVDESRLADAIPTVTCELLRQLEREGR